MKTNRLVINLILLPSILFIASTTLVSAVECPDKLPDGRKALERALAACEKLIEEEEKRLQSQQFQISETEYDIVLIDTEVKKAELNIRSSDLAIHKLNQEIGNKEETIDEFGERISLHQRNLKDVLQKLNESESFGLLNVLLSESSVSGYFTRENEYESLQKKIEESIEDINLLRARLEGGVRVLSEQKGEREAIRVNQKVSVNQIEFQKKKKEEILSFQRKLEDQIEEVITVKESRAAEIRNRLFELRGGGAIPFSEAVEYAELAERVTGVRPAYLLGLIKHESDLGKNVGTGSWRIDMHPTRDRPIFPYIADVLSFDPDELKVSANPGFGWGGAMGPAQFIPSTWVCYGGFVNERTGTCNRTISVLKQTGVLKIGSRGSDVKRLQIFLNKNGFKVANSGPGSPGNETSIYGSKVADAVSRFQEKYSDRILKQYGYTKGTGQVGPSTRNAVNELNFYSGPWIYKSSEDKIRKLTRSKGPSNPYFPRDALLASAVYLEELGAARDECQASRRYYAGGNWRSNIALRYCQAVLSNARGFQRDIDFLYE